ncbi:MAG: hypothetical protein BWX68_02049 [Verrucomicrobia bacterium ADurb.Bin063]|nr:MAG: hypothetical protein BWX68_02049 [Verrucomicrobia bacterium ADurb.Bin063]
MRRSITTGSRFFAKLTQKMPHGCPFSSGRSCLISLMRTAASASKPSSSGRYSKM